MPSGTNPNSLANLKKGGRTSEELREAQKKAAQVRREKRTCAEIAKLILDADAPATEEQIQALSALLGIPEKDITVRVAGMFAQAQKAVKGDLQAMKFLRNMAQEDCGDK